MTEEAGLLALEQAMERLTLSRAEIYRRVKEGGLKARKVEHELCFEPGEVERYAGVMKQEKDTLQEELDRWLQVYSERAAQPLEPAVVGVDATAASSTPGSETDKVAALGEMLLRNAAQSGASDLYLDPVQEGARILLSRSGAVGETARLGGPVADRLRGWLKGLGPLPAEGAVREALVRRDVDGQPRQYRLAVVPTALGELVHLHDFAAGMEDGLEGLGYSHTQAEALRATLGGQPGVYVVAGPPDQWGERHRLAVARELSVAGRLVVSVEHRVHYRSELLVQLEAGCAPELFPSLWRRALDMRPDYVFVDEVRDKVEAACLLEGVQAGAVVVCQVSAPDAAIALRRLLALELDASALGRGLLGCSERLVLRRLCPACRVPATTGGTGWDRGPGCDQCVAGWLGHLALFGIVHPEPALVSWLESGAAGPGPGPGSGELSLVSALRAAVDSGAVDVDTGSSLSRGQAAPA